MLFFKIPEGESEIFFSNLFCLFLFLSFSLFGFTSSFSSFLEQQFQRIFLGPTGIQTIRIFHFFPSITLYPRSTYFSTCIRILFRLQVARDEKRHQTVSVSTRKRRLPEATSGRARSKGKRASWEPRRSAGPRARPYIMLVTIA